jgi:hypothetical protein
MITEIIWQVHERLNKDGPAFATTIEKTWREIGTGPQRGRAIKDGLQLKILTTLDSGEISVQ